MDKVIFSFIPTQVWSYRDRTMLAETILDFLCDARIQFRITFETVKDITVCAFIQVAIDGVYRHRKWYVSLPVNLEVHETCRLAITAARQKEIPS